MARKTSPLTLGVLVGVLAAVGVYFAFMRDHVALVPPPPNKDGYAVSRQSIQDIAAALAQFEKKNGARPAHLWDLVEAGLLQESALRDERRPAVAATTRSAAHADVVYFTPLRPGDDAGLVLLCTLILRQGEERYHVITNDGQYHPMTAAELVTALNRTYTTIGKDIKFTPSEEMK